MKTIRHYGRDLSPDQVREEVRAYYAREFSKRTSRHVRFQELVPPLASGSRVLDFGCGMGGISDLFAEKFGFKVDAIDVSANELEKGRVTFGHNTNIQFSLTSNFSFPPEHYDLVFSSMVLEHVHNVGNHLSLINRMLKKDAFFLVGIPNIVNFGRLIMLLFFTEEYARGHSARHIENYGKERHHINGWDPIHFSIMAASCGFLLERYLPTEGIPLPGAWLWRNLPIIGKFLIPFEKIPWQLPVLGRLSYTTFYLFRKVKDVRIEEND